MRYTILKLKNMVGSLETHARVNPSLLDQRLAHMTLNYENQDKFFHCPS